MKKHITVLEEQKKEEMSLATDIVMNDHFADQFADETIQFMEFVDEFVRNRGIEVSEIPTTEELKRVMREESAVEIGELSDHIEGDERRLAEFQLYCAGSLAIRATKDGRTYTARMCTSDLVPDGEHNIGVNYNIRTDHN